MKILLSTRTHSPQEIEKLALDIGFDDIELRLPIVAEFVPESIVGLSHVHAIHAPIGAFNAAEFEKEVRFGVSIAGELGAGVVNVHPTALSRGGASNVMAGIRCIQRLAALYPALLIAYEVLPRPTKERHKEQQAYSTARAFQLNVVQYGLPATHDSTHVASWGEDQSQYLLRLGKYLRHVHVSDYDPKTGKQHLFLGEGTINFTAFFGALRTVPHYQELCVTFEPGSRFNLLEKENRKRLATSFDIIKKGIS